MPAADQSEILNATIKDVRTLASMLRALSFRSTAVVEIREAGIKFTVEDGRSVQANAYLEASAFQSYTFSLLPARPSSQATNEDHYVRATEDEPIVVFGISISTVLELLNIFGNAGASKAEWSGGSGGHEFGRNRDEQGRGGRRRDGFEHEAEGARRGGGGAPGAATDGPATSLEMSYRGEGHPLVLLLEEGGIVTRCEITTYEPDELMDLFFDDSERAMKFIMKSEWLKDALSELDPSSDRVSFSFSPQDHHAPKKSARYGTASTTNGDRDADEDEVPLFRLESVGNLGSTEMDYPNDPDVLETFECAEPMRNSSVNRSLSNGLCGGKVHIWCYVDRYKYSQIQLIQKALTASIKTSLRTAGDGLMSFQFMIPVGIRTNKAALDKFAFVEFLVSLMSRFYRGAWLPLK